jgi:hypothetical protein
MRGRCIVGLVVAFVAGATPLFAQPPNTFTALLTWVPIGGAERNDVAGEGLATATLSGSRLAIAGSFEGLPQQPPRRSCTRAWRKAHAGPRSRT